MPAVTPVLEILPDPCPDLRLSIPPNATRVLPTDNASVPSLLNHRLPNPLTTSYRSAISPWSNSPPLDIPPSVLPTHLIPPKSILDRLLSEVAGLPQAIQSINRAAVLPDDILPKRLPIWILSFWQQVYKARQWRRRWNACCNWVTASKPRASASLRDRLDRTLVNIHWQGFLNGQRRDRSVEDIFTLLSNSELNSGQVNDLLELIRNQLVAGSDGISPPHLVAPTELAVLVTWSYEHHNKADYRKQLLQATIEEDLIDGRKLSVASVSWISPSGNGHWVPYIVNPASSYIAYGDSLGQPIPETMLAALQWWLLDVREKMNLSVDEPVVIRPILVTPQYDGFSCGILSTNSIGHLLLHDEFPLVGQDPVSIKSYRTKHTIEILMLDAEFVCAGPEKNLITDSCCSRPMILKTQTRSILHFGYPPSNPPPHHHHLIHHRHRFSFTHHRRYLAHHHHC